MFFPSLFLLGLKKKALLVVLVGRRGGGAIASLKGELFVEILAVYGSEGMAGFGVVFKNLLSVGVDSEA